MVRIIGIDNRYYSTGQEEKAKRIAAGIAPASTDRRVHGRFKLNETTFLGLGLRRMPTRRKAHTGLKKLGPLKIFLFFRVATFSS